MSTRKTPPSGRGKLSRTTFKTSRLLEFCSEKELINQTGHHPEKPWDKVVADIARADFVESEEIAT